MVSCRKWAGVPVRRGTANVGNAPKEGLMDAIVVEYVFCLEVVVAFEFR